MKRVKLEGGYRLAKTFFALSLANRKNVYESRVEAGAGKGGGFRAFNCTTRKIVLRIPPSIGEELDRRGASWSWLRYIAHAPPHLLQERINEALAQFPARP